jgi:hypothetical protein
MAGSTALPLCALSLAVATSPNVSSSSPKITHGSLDTVLAAFVFRRPMLVGKRGEGDFMNKVLKKLEKAWAEFKESYAGLSDSQLTEPRVTGNWSVKDIIAHVSWWEEEALNHLPLIIKGGRPPRYSTKYGGIDAFNARMTEQKQGLSLSEVLKQMDETHRRLVSYVLSVPEEQFTRETRARRRLRLDTYGHYPKHAKAIREWRDRSG